MDQLREAAIDYVGSGLVLVPLASASKSPRGGGWNLRKNCVETEERAARLNGNIGLAHAYSRTAALDIDDVAKAGAYLSSHGVDLEAISKAPDAVWISSGRENRRKLLFRLPKDVPPLPTKQLNEFGFELRCATSSGLTTQDVLPPSIHPDTGRPYEWAYADPAIGDWRKLPELPPCILDFWQRLLSEGPPEKKLRPKASACPSEPLRASVFQIDPDIEYPDWIKVGMALHHETGGSDEGLALWDEWSSHGSKYSEQDDLPARWRGFNSQKPKTVGIGTLRMLGEPRPEDFEDLTEGRDGRQRRLKVKGATEFMSRAVTDWWIKGLLPKASLGLVYGATASGKTFWVLDLVSAIAQGKPWRGLPTRRGRIVYVAAEAAGGVAKRVRAYVHHYQAGDAELPAFIDAAPVLVEEVELLAREIESHGGADLIVVDTLAQTIFGADENNSKDMGAVLGACRQLHELTGAMVLLVHHTGKDLARGARGHSSLRAAVDVEIEIFRAEGAQRGARVTKLKDGEDLKTYGFHLLPITIGWDEDDEPITSCIVEHTDAALEAPGPKPKGSWQIAVFEAASALCGGAIREAILSQVLGARTPSDASAKALSNDRFQASRALDTLVLRGVLELRNGLYVRPGAPQAPQTATDVDLSARDS